MFIVFALVGLVCGWLLNIASELLPARRNPSPAAASGKTPRPALLGLLKRDTAQPWFGLHLGSEILTALLFGWLEWRFGLSLMLLVAAVTGSLFILIALIDWKYRLVLNIIVYPAMLVALVLQIVVLHHDPKVILLGGMLAFGVFFLVSFLRPGQLGGGDVKLAALIGLTFGFPEVLYALLVGGGLGGLVALLLISRQAGLKYRIPYAPFLCFGAIVVMLYYSLQITLW